MDEEKVFICFHRFLFVFSSSAEGVILIPNSRERRCEESDEWKKEEGAAFVERSPLSVGCCKTAVCLSARPEKFFYASADASVASSAVASAAASA